MKLHYILFYLMFFSSVVLGYERFYGIATNQNKRPYQEDRFAVVPNIMHGGDFFGIYDGHGGAETATFLQNELHIFFDKIVISDKYATAEIEQIERDLAEKYKFKYEILQKVFNFLLQKVFNSCVALENAFLEAEDFALQNYMDGSTASVVYIDHNNTLYCAWVGDSRVVIEKNGAVGFETRDHKPNDPQELDRIQKQGGTIEKFGVWRVGGLALSRSIGDASIKKDYPGQVIADPDCKMIELDNKNHFLIMASDGLWDVVSSEEAITFVQEQLKNKKFYNKVQSNDSLIQSKDLDEIAHKLQDMAIERGSGDNITICIVAFDWSSYKNLSWMARFWNWLKRS